MEEKEQKALITLLEDPDGDLFEALEKNILSRGLNIVPELESIWEKSLNELLHRRVEDMIENLQFENLLNNLSGWVNSESTDLLKGAYWIAKHQYPELKFETIEKGFNPVFLDTQLEMMDTITPLEKVKILNHIIFGEHKFSAVPVNYLSPQNAYLNQMLDSKKGNNIMLAILYASIAQNLNIPIYGVDLPQNLLLAFVDAKRRPKEREILFYINPYNKGTLLGRREVDFYIKQQNYKPDNHYYSPCSNIEIIERLIDLLIAIYERQKNPTKINHLKKMKKIVSFS
jgi:regulator of sirC expression with transglutaminase-like and TPR domain